MTPELTRQQLTAIGSREVEVLCEAGAGSGKTEVLVRRCLEAVCSDGVELSSILAITFTDRAAEELRERLRFGLEQAAEDEEDPERARELRSLARDTEEAWFSTIHGFCRRILAANPVAAGIDPGFGVLDDGEAGRLKKQAFSQALAAVSAATPEVATRVLAVNKAQDLEDMVIRLHGALRADGRSHPTLPENPADDPEAPTTVGQAEAYGLIRSLLEEFDDHYRQLKARRVGMDFEDLELHALTLLRGGSDQDPDYRAIGERYRSQFTHLLVDEFQDTNPLQLELIESLTGPDTRRFVVGDELQSIYGFRDADVEILRRERRRIDDLDDEAALLAPLTGNFRSHAEVLAAVNAIGHKMIGDDFTALEVGSEVQLEASSDRSPRVELLLTRKDPSARSKPKGPERGTWRETGLIDPGTASNVVVAESRLLASRLAELKQVEPNGSSFVVLVRKRTHVEAIRRALEEYGLEPHVVGGKDFWHGQQVRDLLALLALVSNPFDDTALLSALASPACAASPDSLWMLRRAAGSRTLHAGLLDLVGKSDQTADDDEAEAGWAEHLNERDLVALQDFEQTMEAIRSQSGSLGLSELIDRLCHELSYDLATLMRPNGTERWANIRKLQRIADGFESKEGADIRRFLEFATDESRRNLEGDAPTADESSGGVTVMTIHKAKGLEFDVVAVPQLGTGIGGQSELVRIAFDEEGDEDGESVPRIGMKLNASDSGKESDAWLMKQLKAEESEKVLAEEMRLLHVASTRARSRLLLSGAYTYDRALSDPDERKPPSGSAGMIDRLIHELDLAEPAGAQTENALEVDFPKTVGDLAPTAEKIPIRVIWNFPGDAAVEKLTPPGESPGSEPEAAEEAESAPEPIALPSASQANRFSFSSLSIFERCGYRFYAERELGLKRYGPPSSVSTLAENPDEAQEPAPATSGEIMTADDEIPSSPDQLSLRYGPGNAVHRLLEWSSHNDWAEPDDTRIQEALVTEGLSGDSGRVAKARNLVEAWLGSGILSSIRERGMTISAELPFVLPVEGTMINGSIDLVAMDGDGDHVEIVDYKTNSLRSKSPEDLMGHYLTQRDIYALAASHLGRPVTAHYVFLEDAGRPVSATYDAAGLDRARSELYALLSRIAGAEFRVTDHPHRALCHDCPAFRLCPHPREIRDRESPDPAVTSDS